MAEELELARAAAQAALATDGVYSMGRGRYVEAATYEGTEKVSGVVVKPDEVEIHIVARYPLPSPIPEISRSIIERVAPRASDRRIVVVVDDLEVAAS
ncbi:MAG TPA: hypothetical protein VGP74_02845 [Rubrobacteraceae bacterium]|nr:hypothetical protein [Rubrobacteraceae bacterium]